NLTKYAVLFDVVPMGISVTDDHVVILAGYTAEQAIEQGLWDGELLLGFDRHTGRRLRF
ncbi:MAG: hypothetical protein HGA86_03805, partial [Anaerolineaceae bacterium]|nr:hypothetical protein [Anaerolineaceae bacterium]